MTRHRLPDVAGASALELDGVAVDATVPEHPRWTDVRRGEELVLTSPALRLPPDGHPAV